MSHWSAAFDGGLSRPAGICSEILAFLDGTVVILSLSCDNSHHRASDDAPFLHHDAAHNLDWYVP